jgi:hypothetical protein
VIVKAVEESRLWVYQISVAKSDELVDTTLVRLGRAKVDVHYGLASLHVHRNVDANNNKKYGSDQVGPNVACLIMNLEERLQSESG